MLKVTEGREKLVELVGEEHLITGGRLKFTEDKVGIGSDMIEKTEHFDKDLCSRVRIPWALYQRCSSILQSKILTELLNDTDVGKYSILVRADKADAVLSTKDRFVPALKVFDYCVDSIKEASIESVNKYGGRIDFSILSDSKIAEPRKGDICKGGALVSIGDIGISSRLSVEAYFYRLVCQNGMLRKESRVNFIGRQFESDDSLLANCRRAVNSILDFISNRVIPDVLHSTANVVKDPAQLLHAVVLESKIPVELEGELLDLLPTLGENPTVYDIMNLITNLANGVPQFKRRLQLLGGSLVNTAVNRCTFCRRKL